MKPFLNNFVWFYIVLVVFDLACGFAKLSDFRVFSKPLILSSLIIYFFLKAKTNIGTPFYLMLAALFFSLLGDIFLLFDEISSLYFTLGLASFLIAHLLYTILFLKKRNSEISTKLKWLSLLVISYGTLLFLILRPNLGSLQIPVILYVVGILAMILTAMYRLNKVPDSSYILVLIGAALFVVSDSILAINKFLVDVPFSHILIMGTYASAQLLITQGILKQGDFDN